MRYLTIKRRKSFVACLGKLKIYIEDHENGEIYINDIPCRKLGVIKNGEEATFSVEETPLKVFAIFDKLSKNYCNDFYQLEEGDEDIYLSGVCNYAPVSGNAFVFDNNDNEEAKLNRKKNKKFGWIIMLIAIVAGFIIGFSITSSMF